MLAPPGSAYEMRDLAVELEAHDFNDSGVHERAQGAEATETAASRNAITLRYDNVKTELAFQNFMFKGRLILPLTMACTPATFAFVLAFYSPGLDGWVQALCGVGMVLCGVLVLGHALMLCRPAWFDPKAIPRYEEQALAGVFAVALLGMAADVALRAVRFAAAALYATVDVFRNGSADCSHRTACRPGSAHNSRLALPAMAPSHVFFTSPFTSGDATIQLQHASSEQRGVDVSRDTQEAFCPTGCGPVPRILKNTLIPSLLLFLFCFPRDPNETVICVSPPPGR